MQAVRGFAEQQGVKARRLQSKASQRFLPTVTAWCRSLINLVSNAIKFSPKGGIVTLAIAEESDSIRFNIIDQGRGVPEQLREAIFDRFKQVEDSTMPRLKVAADWGLAICKAIVERHGGTIGVDSQEGKGSTFWLKYPVKFNKYRNTSYLRFMWPKF
jgi:signal transduction histidine kinase